MPPLRQPGRSRASRSRSYIRARFISRGPAAEREHFHTAVQAKMSVFITGGSGEAWSASSKLQFDSGLHHRSERCRTGYSRFLNSARLDLVTKYNETKSLKVRKVIKLVISLIFDTKSLALYFG